MQTFTVTYPWDENGYTPKITYTLDVNETGFTMHITAYEKNPKRVMTEHFQHVHLDSCVEWFVNFLPEKCDRYFNFEVNANGVLNTHFRKDRYDTTNLTKTDAEALNIIPTIFDDRWEISYTVPFTWIKKFIPEFEYKKGMTIKCNFYKCGDETEFPHYGIWNVSPLDAPDFHRPEFFADVTI